MTKLKKARGGAISIDFEYNGVSCTTTVAFFYDGIVVNLEDTGERVAIRKQGTKYVGSPARS